MTNTQATQIVEHQRRFFSTGATHDIAFRRRALADLKRAILDHEQALYDALKADLSKSPTDTYLSEMFPVIREIGWARKHLRRWSRPRRPGLPPYLWPGTGRVVPQPYGSVLVIAPWNFPFQLLFAPAVGALAAGNCCVLKPSELAPHTSQVSRAIVEQAFPPELVTVVEGGAEQCQELLAQKFDYFFFTGGTTVGQIVMEAAAKHLAPISLELGGKNPCIVSDDCHLDRTASRIAWGKFLNAGQTCVAPDYLLVAREIKDRLITALKQKVIEMYGDDPRLSPDYCRVINLHHLQRLQELLAEGQIVFGGAVDKEQLYIEPTLIAEVPLTSKLMSEEIFGPLLPIIPYDTIDEAIDIVRSKAPPLSLYVFSSNSDLTDRVARATSSGAFCINDVVVHFTATTLPFGGVGASGIGAYHGRHSFDTFSHFRAIMKRPWIRDMPLRYPPFAKRGWWLAWLKRLFG